MEYKCNSCQWEGTNEELDYDSVTTCMGEDKIEICPKCGSYEVVFSSHGVASSHTVTTN